MTTFRRNLLKAMDEKLCDIARSLYTMGDAETVAIAERLEPIIASIRELTEKQPEKPE